ncbi:macro domain-containing protein [Halomonas sp.]|uniref:macro domain-containing protein n=1 Tax=Halomonas sp. TaxID=1486246 RepID=UPI00384F5C62
MGFVIIRGNIFTTRCQTIVNTVNCVGVMGAGIALECRLRYPAMYERYEALCQQKLLQPGKLWLYRSPERWLLNFPTKQHWKHPSRLSYLRQGLEKFVATYRDKGIHSIAFPLLGADRGGIDPGDSLALIQGYLDTGLEDLDIEVYRYDPGARDDLFERFKDDLQQMAPAAITHTTGIKARQLDALLMALENPAICQINQLINAPGVGLATLEKAFGHAAPHEQSVPAGPTDLFS